EEAGGFLEQGADVGAFAFVAFGGVGEPVVGGVEDVALDEPVDGFGEFGVAVFRCDGGGFAEGGPGEGLWLVGGLRKGAEFEGGGEDLGGFQAGDGSIGGGDGRAGEGDLGGCERGVEGGGELGGRDGRGL